MARLEGTGFQELEEIIAYHQDVTAALTLYFSDWETIASARYAGWTESEVGAIGQVRFEETNSRSILQLLSSIEAALRLDYLARCERKAKDPLSRAFRAYRQEVQRARLDALLGLWAHHHPELKNIVARLRRASHLRDWLAHGRSWQLKVQYSYLEIEALATAFFNRFPLSE